MAAGVEPFAVCMSAYLAGRLRPIEFSSIYFDLCRVSPTGLPEDIQSIVTDAMYEVEDFTDIPRLVGNGLIGPEELHERIGAIKRRLDAATAEGRAGEVD